MFYYLHDNQLRVTRTDGSTVATVSVPDDPFAAAMSPGGGIIVVASDAGYRLYVIGGRDIGDVTPSFDVTAGARVVTSSTKAYLIDGTSIGIVTAYE